MDPRPAKDVGLAVNSVASAADLAALVAARRRRAVPAALAAAALMAALVVCWELIARATWTATGGMGRTDEETAVVVDLEWPTPCASSSSAARPRVSAS